VTTMRQPMLVVACAALSLVPVASTTVAAAGVAPAKTSGSWPPYPSKCPLSIAAFQGTNCLVDEGMVLSCDFIKAGTDGCKAVQAGFNYVLTGKPVANQNLHVSVAAWSYASGDPAAAARAIPVCERAVEAARHFAPAVLAFTMQPLMWANMDAGFVGAARQCGEEALALTGAAGLSIGESRLAVNLARIAIESGDNATAWRYAERAVEVARGTSDTFVVIVGTQLLAQLAEARGDLRSARDLLVSVFDSVSETQTVEQLGELRRDIARYEALTSEVR
jgi:hypothetical protein